MKLLIVLCALLLAGCTTVPANPNFTAEQLTALVKDKSAAAVCVQVIAPAGTVRMAVVNLDKGVVPNGSIVVDPSNANCVVTMSNAK